MRFLLFTIFFLFFCNTSFSQNENKLFFKKSTFELVGKDEGLDHQLKNIKSSESSYYKGHYYFIVQFDEIPNYKEQTEFRNRGILLLSYIPNNAYLVKMSKKALSDNHWLKKANTILPYHAGLKLGSIEDIVTSEFYIHVLLHEQVSEQIAIKEFGNNVIQWEEFYSNGRMLKLKVNKSQVDKISEHPLVNYISPTAKDHLLHVEECKETARVGQANHNSGLGLTGNGVVVSVGDGGTINNHPDLNDRIQNESFVDISSHGSLTAGIVASEGILDPMAKGFAPECDVYADYYSSVIFNDDAYYNNVGAVISNNSYSTNTIISVCDDAGEYTAESVDVDGSLRTLDEVVHVFSSANDGNATCGTYPYGYATVRNAWNSAKNTLTVGSTDSQDVIAGYSSRGPVKDGRLKPEIVAVGSNVYSTDKDSDYTSASGTSFSAPAVSGALALLYQYYKSLNGGNNPKGDLMKAIVANTARDLGNAGPDFIYGFGALDTYRATEVISNVNYTTGSISNGGNNTHSLVIPAGVNKLKVMLYWHDVEGTASVSPALVNNLDFSVVDPGSSTILPLVLDPSPANCSNVAVQGVDNLNNIEQVVIDNPSSGTYTLTVDGTNIPMGMQDYVIVYDVISDHLKLSSPLGGENYSTGETVNITWNASGFDANTFTLEYSLDDGGTWNIISNSIAGTARNYEWTTPNTFTDEGLIRLTWNSSGLPVEESYSNFTIMDTPNTLTLTPRCDEDIRISWSSLSGIASYDVMEYTAGAWNLVANTTSTNHTVTGLIAGQTYYYSVRGISTSGVVGPIRTGKSAVALGDDISGSISSFPYLEDFETNDGNWKTYGKNSSWEYGTPSNSIINRAAEGDNCWVTNLTGDYNNAELSYLVSPCFDLSGVTTPTLSFAFILDIEDADDGFGNPFYDFARVEYSTNGRTWNTIGTNGTGHNWYNNYTGQNMWDDTKGYWHSATYEIPSNSSRVTIRFVLNSDPFATQEGFAVDNIRIYDAETLYSGANTSVTSNVSGTDWIHFESGGDRVVSINPNGQNLGSTSSDVYINTGTLRDNSEQYYLDRNWKITPSNAPTSDVSVRLYLLDTEVEALRAAAGSCGACSTISDAFIAGVTKYSGVNENGDLADNDENTYTYFIPDDVEFVPFADGYYVEFNTSSFSEFYINGGHTNMDTPLPVELIDFTLTKDGEDAILDWITASEVNTDKFIIELAKGDNAFAIGDFNKIAEVTAAGESSINIHYQYKDTQANKIGKRYYRLKMVDLDGSFEYTEVKVLDFGNDFNVSVFPNPSKGQFTLTVTSQKEASATLKILDHLGKEILNKEISILEGINNLEHLTSGFYLPTGIYHLTLISDDNSYIQKIMISE